MPSILVVCTGNICRSPMAEGFLRDALNRRAEGVFTLASAGTWGWEGSAAVPEAVEVARERGVDITGHLGRRLNPELIAHADLVVGMTHEHRDASVATVPEAAAKAFTLKELVHLLENLEPATGDTDLAGRVAEVAALREGGFNGTPGDEDVVDPLGMPVETFRAVAWEIDEHCERLATGLAGPAPARAEPAAEEA